MTDECSWHPSGRAASAALENAIDPRLSDRREGTESAATAVRTPVLLPAHGDCPGVPVYKPERPCDPVVQAMRDPPAS